jgi:N-acetylated-alpha-linked acidic dipeptidase
MHRVLTLIVLSTLLLSPEVSAEPQEPLGFFASSRESQGDAEAVFLRTPTPEKARQWLARLTEEPHVAGTPQEKKVADYVRERLEEFGLETEVATYQVYLNYPKSVAAKLVQPEEIELSLREDFLDEDKDSSAHGMFPAFHGYSASGEVSGQVVYVNYGTPADYKKLEEMGISIEGRIALARYGNVFRGLKVWQAEERGAVGVLIYSDPADDGYMKGDVYPAGPMRPASAIQRGSVQFLSHQPGDPSTPGYPSRDGAPRLSREEMKGVPKIPSLPLSYGEAEKILRHMGGPGVPDGWQGGLPFAYHVGPGGSAVEMSVEMEGGLRPIFNVFGIIRGTDDPERLVILGNHRDAWNHGAVDPNSGTAAWLETARGLAAAVESGWRPRRTIMLASWDAEEYGLLGSVEWGEDHAEDLQERLVAYVNLDSAVTGTDLGISGSPSLRDLARQAAAAVTDPRKGGTVGEEWERRMAGKWAKEATVELSRPAEAFELQLGALGSGSDYTVFLDHLGVASLDFGFRGPYGVYHSVYDSFRWMDKFGDPGFSYHAAAARLFGIFAMRLAGADVLPLRFGSYSRALETHLEDIQRRVIRAHRRASLNEVELGLVADFEPILSALEAFGASGAALDAAVDRAVAREDTAAATTLNEAIMLLERRFLADDGLPERPWFRHLLFAPGLTTGYAAWPFPELAEAVENKDSELFAHGSRRIVEVLEKATAQLEGAGRQVTGQGD